MKNIKKMNYKIDILKDNTLKLLDRRQGVKDEIIKR